MRKLLQGLWRVLTLPFDRTYHFFTDPAPDEPMVETLQKAADPASFWQAIVGHIESLRGRLLRSLVALIITVSVSFVFNTRLLEFLALPVGGLGELIVIEVTEQIGVYMRVALLAGVTVALPYIVTQMWIFIAPGFSPRTRWLGLLSIPLATLLFVGGMAFAFYVMLPVALPLLAQILQVETQWTAQSYFAFVTNLLFWIGVSAEFPLIIAALSGVGLVSPDALKKQWRLAVVLIAVFAAVITPTVDPINMGLLMLPLILLYLLSIGLSRLTYRRSRPAQTAE